jgi:hypothetical protein
VLQARPDNVDPISNRVTDSIHMRFPPMRSIDHPVSGITVASASK